MGKSRADDHRRQIDGLRFFAFLGVFIFHALGDRASLGALGVPLFFTLSGFLITRIILLHEGNSLWRGLGVFYARRVLRIFPIYYGVLFVLFSLNILPYPGWQFAYIQNFLMFKQGNFIYPAHFWSLCVEEQFYLTYPVILLLTPRFYRMYTLLVLLAISVVSRFLLDCWFPGDRMNEVLLPTSGEYLVWGCIAGLCDIRLGGRRVRGTAIFCAGCTLFALYCLSMAFALTDFVRNSNVRTTLIGIAFSAMVFGLWHSTNKWLISTFSLRPLVYLGKISYGLYVYHLFAIDVASYFVRLGIPGLWRIHEGVAFFITVAMAALSWHCFELPINNLKKHFSYTKRQGAVLLEHPDDKSEASLMRTSCSSLCQ